MKYAVAAGVGALLVLAWVPDRDLACAHFFYMGGGHFMGNGPIGIAARNVARFVPLLLFGGVLLLHIASRIGLIAASHAPSSRSLLFLTLSLTLGPGLLVNLLKDEMHRPRPIQIREFDGKLAFMPFYSPYGACPRNCAFPSGEAAAAFWTAAPASLAPMPLQPALMALALLFGLMTGGLRMAAGAHFLSDILSAGVLTLTLNAALRRLLLPKSPRAFSDRVESPDREENAPNQ
ncbi:MAG: phosphatase PAP2 family protein [Methylovirgula sp.]